MSRPIFALFTRALRLEARQNLPYLARIILVGVILLELLIFYAASSRMGAPGLQFFSVVFFTNLVVITLAGIGYFATAITEEKEEMTLGLLRMTRLDPLSILLGKSTVRLIGALMLLVMQLPFTLLAITLGGVALNQVLAAYLTLLSYMVFISSLGLFWSVICDKSGNAGGAVLLSLLLFFCLPLGSPLIHELELDGKLELNGTFAVTARSCFEATLEANPFKRGSDILQTGFSGHLVGAQFISNIVLGILLFLAAWRLFEFFTREQKEASPARGLLARGSRGRRRLLAPGRVWRNALAWKDFYFMAGGWWTALLTYLVCGAILGTIYWLICKYDSYPPNLAEYAFAAQFPVWIIFGLQTLFAAGRVFAEERNWQTWPNLMCLPISTGKLAWSKVLGIFAGTIPLASIAATLSLMGIFSRHMVWDKDVLPYLFQGVAQWIFLLHLTLFMSLYVKRGAGLIALGIWFFAAQFFVAIVMLLSGLFLLGTAVALYGTGAALLLLSLGSHRLIRERLELLAGL